MIVNVQRQIRWIGTQPVFSPPKDGKTRVVPLEQGVLDDIDDYMVTFEPVTLRSLGSNQAAGRRRCAS